VKSILSRYYENTVVITSFKSRYDEKQSYYYEFQKSLLRE